MQKLCGICFSVFGLIILMALFNSGNSTPLLQWPVEGFQNLAFSIGWLSPFSETVVYVLTTLVVLLVAIVFYKVGVWLYQKLSH